MKFKLSLFVILFGSCVLASANFYKWVDENGRVNYSDSPPADSNIESESFNRMQVNGIQEKHTKEDAAENEESEGNASENSEGAEVSEREAICSQSVAKISATHSTVQSTIEVQRHKKQIEEYQYQQAKDLLDKLKSMANLDACIKSSASQFKDYKCLAESSTVNECLN